MARTRRNRSRGGEIGNNVVPNRIPPPLPISTRPLVRRPLPPPPPGNMTNADKANIIEGIKKECNAIREELKRGTKYNETIKKITNNRDTLYPQNVKEYIVNSVRTIYDTVFGNEKSWFSKKNDVPLTIARAIKAKNAINELLTTGDCGDACKNLDIGLKSREIPDGYAKAHFRNHYMQGGSRKRNHRNNKTRRHKK